MRKAFVFIHRYVGLAMTLFLVIVAVTGSVLAFYHELDRWLNPELLTVPVRQGPMLDPFVLRERAEALEARARVNYLTLDIEPGDAFQAWLEPRLDPATGKEYELPYSELLIDPYTGEKLGSRTWGEVSLAKENLLSFLYHLHMSLALPESLGNLGTYVLGITALVWTLDCFVGFYLTLPPWRKRTSENNGAVRSLSHREKAGARGSYERQSKTGRGRRRPCLARRGCKVGTRGAGEGTKSSPHQGEIQISFWLRWKPAWLIKRSRLNYDLHRASGLWVWAMLFVLALSSVALNLNAEVYRPVMQLAFDLRDPEDLPTLDKPLESPLLGWRAAYAHGQRLMTEAGARHGFAVLEEQYMWLDREHGIYSYTVKSSEDWGDSGGTSVSFDANTGALKRLIMPGSEASGDVVTRWLVWLHTARVFGLPMQTFVCVMGLIITALSVTGVVIWWRKHRSLRHRRERRAGEVRSFAQGAPLGRHAGERAFQNRSPGCALPRASCLAARVAGEENRLPVSRRRSRARRVRSFHERAGCASGTRAARLSHHRCPGSLGESSAAARDRARLLGGPGRRARGAHALARRACAHPRNLAGDRCRTRQAAEPGAPRPFSWRNWRG